MSSQLSLRQSVGWLFIGNTGNQLLTFAFGLVLARLLTPEDFGLIVTIQVFTGLAGFVSGGGMGQALVRAQETKKADFDIVFTLQLMIGVAIYLFFFTLAPWMSDWYNDARYTDLLRVSAITFLSRPFVNLPGCIMHREMRFKEGTFVRLAALLISSAVSIGMAANGYGVWSLVVGGLAGSVVNMVLLARYARWRPGFSLDFARGRELARYGFLVSLNDVVVYVRFQTTNFILGRTLGMGAVGLFNKADSLVKTPHSFIAGSVYHVLFRALAKAHDDTRRSIELFMQSQRLVAVYATPCYVFLFWLAEPLISVLYGDRWADAAAPLAMLAISGPLVTIENLSGAVLAARNWLGRELGVQVLMVVLVAGASLAGLQYGLAGISALLIGVTLYNAIHMYSLAARCLGTGWVDLLRALVPAAILNTILVGSLWLFDLLLAHHGHVQPLVRLLLLGCGGSLVYIAAFLILPIATLETERSRWKEKLGLKRASTGP